MSPAAWFAFGLVFAAGLVTGAVLGWLAAGGRL